MKQLLFVEPDKSLGKIYSDYFRKLNYSVKWVQTSEEAILVIDTYKPDLIILELLIAQHNGLEFLYELRSYSDWQKIKVLLHTNVVESKLLSSPVYHKLSISGYLYKPTTTLELFSKKVQLVLNT